MNDKLILLKSILLLYRESLIPNSNGEDTSATIIRKSLELVKKTDTSIGVTKEGDIIIGLKDTVLEMLVNPPGYVYIKEDLLNRIRLTCEDDENLYGVFYDSLNVDLDEFKLKQAIVNDRRTLSAQNRYEDIAKVVKGGYGELLHNKDKIKDLGKWASALRAGLEPFEASLDDKDRAITDEIDVEDEGDIARVAKEMSDEISGDLGFQFGYQDINEMLMGKVRRGENVVIPAMQHNYKTGFSMSLFVQACVFNKPAMLDPSKKPLMLHISFEDSLTKNLQFVYKYLYENETGTVINEEDIARIDPNVISAFIKERLKKTGYNVKFLKVDPLSWTINDLFNRCLYYEAQGYEIHMCMVDYLPKLPTTGCTGNNGSEELRNLLERFRQFFMKRKATNITPWQIAPDAKELIRDGTTDFVKKLFGRGYYSGSKQIDQVMDVEIFIHKETYKNESFLTVQAGKFRRVQKPTPDKEYRVYKFIPGGCIPWDIGKPNSARLKVGGETIAELGDESVDNWDQFGGL